MAGGGVKTTDGEIVASADMLQGARVRLMPELYNPLASDSLPESLTAVTDSAGKYAFKNVPPGHYNLEAWQPRNGNKLWLPGLVFAGTGSRTLPAAKLAHMGKLRLNWEGGHHGYLFMPGTSTLHRILPEETEIPAIVLDSLPMGVLPPVFWSQTKPDTVETGITAMLPPSRCWSA